MSGYADTHYELNITKPDLGKGTVRIAFLCDLHNRADEADTEEMLSAIRRARPDIVLCGGDMILAKPGESVEPAVDFMQKLGTEFGVFVGTGNHEYRAKLYRTQYGSMYDDYIEELEGCGVTFLENRRADLDICGFPVQIFGFDMRKLYYRRFFHPELPPVEIREAVGVPDPDKISILLAHNPAGMKAYFRWGADLTLCGHYHGGIVRIGRHHGLVSPDFRVFPGNAYGLFEKDGKTVIVSSGCGEHTVPVRINNPREIVTVDIHVNP